MAHKVVTPKNSSHPSMGCGACAVALDSVCEMRGSQDPGPWEPGACRSWQMAPGPPGWLQTSLTTPRPGVYRLITLSVGREGTEAQWPIGHPADLHVHRFQMCPEPGLRSWMGCWTLEGKGWSLWWPVSRGQPAPRGGELCQAPLCGLGGLGQDQPAQRGHPCPHTASQLPGWFLCEPGLEGSRKGAQSQPARRAEGGPGAWLGQCMPPRGLLPGE